MPLEVGGCTTLESIASMWKDKYRKLLNSSIVDYRRVDVLLLGQVFVALKDLKNCTYF